VSTPSERILQALQAEHEMDEDIEGGVVVGFAAVVEWLAPDGKRWLTLLDGDASGERLYRWQVQGYFHNVLHDPSWHPVDDEDDDVDA
jgi:hypothetical protein